MLAQLPGSGQQIMGVCFIFLLICSGHFCTKESKESDPQVENCWL